MHFLRNLNLEYAWIISATHYFFAALFLMCGLSTCLHQRKNSICLLAYISDAIARFQETMIDPVVFLDPNDGVSYERSALQEWVARTGYEERLQPKLPIRLELHSHTSSRTVDLADFDLADFCLV